MLNLNSTGVKIKEEDHTIILLSSLPKLYEHFVDTMLYGKQTLTMTEVKTPLNSKELQRKSESKEESNDEGLTTQGRPQKKDNKNSKNPDQNPKLEENVSFATKRDIIKRNAMKGKSW
ncbi:hypothetical protein PVL29_009400 [Vitis rotundifolia]|uniref:Retrovirus-related Pol polyprotein from transposon TNT 1-94 n=1 Tax=Vitis rotundifolia TaxID=103349 RepID=A0AA39DVE6_VITRO|nr:hypothetical protein PVL29_009400 [Vitis rotundifolia]